VVNISGEPLLLPPPATHETLGGFCAFLLKLASQANVASSATVDLRPGEACSVRRLSDGNESKIYAKPIQNFGFFLVGHINSRKEKPFLVAINQVSLAPLEGEQITVMVTTHKRNLLPTVKRPNTSCALIHVPRQDAEVITDRAALAKLSLNLLIKLVGVGHFGVQPHHHLSRQWKLISYQSVKTLVQRILAKLFGFPRQFTQSIAGGVDSLNCAQQSVRPLGRRLEFYLRGQLDVKNKCFKA
jgi:hypothetical protein